MKCLAMKKQCLLVGMIIGLGLTGCADKLTGDVYTRDEARQSMSVRYGWVESVRPVAIEGERGFIGQAGGGVVGGIAGSAVGGGRGQMLGTAVGAIAGAVVGGAAQEKITRAQGAEITVRMDGGDSQAIVQEVSNINEFVAGQRVRITGNNNSARVAPLNGQR